MPPDPFPQTSDAATARLRLPYLAAGQAQKHVTVNEALSALDGLIQTAAVSATVAAQPQAPAEGAVYILPPGRTGVEWALHPEGAVLRHEAGGWTPLAAGDGFLVYVADTGALLLRRGGVWTPLASAIKALQGLERLGLGTEADAANPLAAKLNKALFTARPAAEGGDGDLRITFNKEGAADVLSLLLQSGYSGRAELGLVGENALTLRTSADGAAWREAARVDEATGRLWTGGIQPDRAQALNLLPDSGRFVPAAQPFTGGAFTQPAYLFAEGGSTFAPGARFIHNNSDYGGAQGALDPEVRALIDKIRPPEARRYGSDWWTLRVTRGTGAADPITVGGEVFDIAFTSAPPGPLPARLTVGYYLRVLGGKALVQHNTVEASAIDDVAYTPASSPTVLTAADGWRYVNLLTRPNIYGYEYRLWALRATHGAQLLVAMPRIAAGHVRFDKSLGVLASARVWG